MKLRKCFRHALNMVLHSKLRSWLTIIGIVIGVASVIAIISIGEGMQQSITSQMNDLGGDIITLSAGFSRGSRMFGGQRGGGTSQATQDEIILSRTDLQVLKGIPDIALLNTQIRGSVEVSYMGKKGSVSVTGVDQKIWSQITTTDMKEGRFLDSADQNVVVIGSRLAASYFDKPVGLNKMITIENSAFRVVGILDDNSNSIYMPIQMAYQVLEDKTNEVYDTITIKIKNEDDLDAVIEKIEKKLMTSRHVNAKTKDFSLSSSKQMMETRSEMIASMSAFLVAIAAVSLIVGAVGIANTMFTSVLEKTKEIGVMKSIGARNKDILMIFLLNSALIGLVGGMIGIFFGIILSGAMPALMSGIRMGRSSGGTVISMSSIIWALSVSVIVGMVSGIIPAYKASKLKPVDALRYE